MGSRYRIEGTSGAVLPVDNERQAVELARRISGRRPGVFAVSRSNGRGLWTLIATAEAGEVEHLDREGLH